MKPFNTESFEFLKFDPTVFKHQEFLQNLKQDEVIESQYRIEKIIEDLETLDDGVLQTYLVGNKTEDIIGFMGIKTEWFKQLELDWAVIKKIRGLRDRNLETIGSKIIREASNYLLKQQKDLQYLKMFIDQQNIRTIKAAFHAGFTYMDMGKTKFVKLESTDFKPDHGLIKR